MMQIVSRGASDIREAISQIADQLCLTVDQDFNLFLSVDTPDEEVQKLAIMINFVLENVRRNIHELEETKRDLEATVVARTDELNLILDGANDGVWVWDVDNDQVRYSQRWLQLAGLHETPDEVDLGFWFDRVHRKDRDALQAEIRSHLDGVKPYIEIESRIRHASGTYRWTLCRGIAQRDDNGRAIKIAGTLSDITERRCIDPQSGLPNERSFQERISDIIDEQGDAAVALVSVDKMSVFVEALDGKALSELRAAVRRLLVENLPMNAMLARMYGDIYGVVLPHRTNGDDITRPFEKVFEILREPLRVGPNKSHWVNLSVGAVQVIESGATDVDEMLQCSWAALSYARQNEGSYVKLFDPELRQMTVEKLEIESTVREALQDGRVLPHFQPIVDLEDTSIHGFEALVRMTDTTGKLIPPGQFLPVIEPTEMITTVGSLMLFQSIEMFSKWRTAGWVPDDAAISVNLASRQVINHGLVEEVEALLSAHDLPATCLKLEVTETAVVTDLNKAIDTLERLRALGAKIALDDFGTGYSSLDYIRRLPIDVLKMDRSFVRDIDIHPDKQAIAQTICNLAKLLGLEVIAEGVETTAEVDVLRRLRVRYIQGFLYSRPIAPSEISAEALKQIASSV